MLTPFAQPSRVTRMNSAAGPWNHVAIITPSSCHTVRKRSQSPASRQTAQFSIRARMSCRSMRSPSVTSGPVKTPVVAQA